MEKTTTDGKWFNYNDWEKIRLKTITIGIPFVVVNYNDWEKLDGKTTMIGIPTVGGNYNGWERASSNY